MARIISSGPATKVDYIEIMDPESLVPVEKVKKGDVAAVAAFVNNVRLIDNIVLG